MQNIYFWVAGTHFIDEECWIYTWACNWNDIRITENQATRWWTTTSYKIETKSWPNKNKKIFGCCRFCARLQLQYLTSKFKFQQILSQNSTVKIFIFWYLTNPTYLILRGNQISGFIPHEIGEIKNLVSFSFIWWTTWSNSFWNWENE